MAPIHLTVFREGESGARRVREPVADARLVHPAATAASAVDDEPGRGHHPAAAALRRTPVARLGRRQQEGELRLIGRARCTMRPH